ncbi:MAG: hypothetical protein HRU11_10720, partial [Parvularculaceae bacterium]|nr:hypothetical protein [Parvularculaceae bacterium]
MKRILLGLCALAAGVGSAHADTLKIGFLRAEGPKGCLAESELVEPGALAYLTHLQARFSSPLQICFDATGADLLKQNVDLVWGDRTDLSSFATTHRPFLTRRVSQTLSRVQIVFFNLEGGEDLAVEEVAGLSLALNKQLPSALNQDMALRVLNNFGVDEHGMNLVLADDSASVAEAVRSGKVDFGALEMSSWARNCAVYRSDQKGCSDLNVFWVERPRAEVGMMIKKDATKEFQFRMVGGHA